MLLLAPFGRSAAITCHMLYLHSCHMIRFFQIETVSQDFTHFFIGLHQPENSQCTFLFHRVFHMLFRPITVSTNFTYFFTWKVLYFKEVLLISQDVSYNQGIFHILFHLAFSVWKKMFDFTHFFDWVESTSKFGVRSTVYFTGRFT